MLPIHLLSKLSPAAAKLYLILLLHTDPLRNRLHARLPMARLAELTGFSPRTCSRAIQQLKTLHLLRVSPFRYHDIRTYRLTLQPTSPPSSPNAPKSHPTASPPMATHHHPAPSPTPRNARKTQASPPMATLLNKRSAHSHATPDLHQLDLRLRELQASLKPPPLSPFDRAIDEALLILIGKGGKR